MGLGRSGVSPRCFFLRDEAHGLGADALGNHFLQSDKRAAADEEDVGGVDRREFLVGMLAAALRRNVGDGAFQDFEQRLLDAFAGDVAGDGGVLVLAPDLIDLVDIDDALLAALDIPIGILKQPKDDVLHVFADIAGFGEGGGIHDGEGDIQNASQGLGQQGLAGAGGPDQQNVGFRELHFGAALLVHLDALVVVVDSDGELLFGGVLADHVLIKIFF